MGCNPALLVSCGWLSGVQGMWHSLWTMRLASLFLFLSFVFKQRFRGLFPYDDLFLISKFGWGFLFGLGQVFSCLRVTWILDWEKIRDIHKLFLIEILWGAHHGFVFFEVWLDVLHVNELRALVGVTDTTSCAWPSIANDLVECVAYFCMLRPDSVPDLRPELIRLIMF